MKKNNSILYISLVLLLLPVITFFIGYLKLYIGIPCTILLLICTYRLIKNEDLKVDLSFKKKYVPIIIFIGLFIWLFFSGIGSFAYQNSDFEVRNAILHDLVDYKWPVTYDFTNLSSNYQSILNASSAKLIYYFTYWLPASIIGKLINYQASTVFIFIYSLLFLIVIYLLIKNKTKLNPIYILLILIFFSGLDCIVNITDIFNLAHIERSFDVVQYSSNTTLLYWVFNQTLPIWLITALIMNFKKVSSIIFIGCLSFCYSPFATFGMIPICIGYCLIKKTNKEKLLEFIKKNIPYIELLFVLVILIVFGSFYLSSTKNITANNFTWIAKHLSFIKYIGIYISFIFTEVLVYIVIIHNKYKKDLIYKIVLLELLLFPLYCLTPANDFCMRGSIPALFLLMMFVINYLEDKKSKDKIILIIVLLLGSITPIHEIGRSIHETFTLEPKQYISEHGIKSIGNPLREEGLILCNEQFYSKNYKKTFFFKYLSK